MSMLSLEMVWKERSDLEGVCVAGNAVRMEREEWIGFQEVTGFGKSEGV